jgi:hypothetical protein
VPGNAQQPFEAAPTDPFQDSALDRVAGAFILAPSSLQRAIAGAGFAVIFLVAFVIPSVLDHIQASAFRTTVRYLRLHK